MARLILVDSRQGLEDGHVKNALPRRRLLLAERGAEFIEFALGVTKLAIDKAQASGQGAEVEHRPLSATPAATLMAGWRKVHKTIATSRQECEYDK